MNLPCGGKVIEGGRIFRDRGKDGRWGGRERRGGEIGGGLNMENVGERAWPKGIRGSK